MVASSGSKSEISMGDLRIFWKIIIDACCGQDKTDVTGVNARKEVAVWGKDDGGLRHRYHWRSFPLTVTPHCLSDPNIATIEHGEIVLDGCYLEIYDEGLQIQAEQMGLDLPSGLLQSDPIAVVKEFVYAIASQTKLEHRQFREGNSYYVGENIRLEVEFKAEGAGNHPLFHHRQFYTSGDSPGAVLAMEKIQAPENERTAVWEVNAPGATIRSENYCINKNEPHNLVVSQDQNFIFLAETRDDQRYFEFLLDAVPIRHPLLDDATHLFHTGEETIYVGYSPDVGSDTLRGSIRRIVFDPNASCVDC